MEKVYKALYPELGGPAKAFVCGVDPSCSDVTRTRIGMIRHLWRKHKVKIQISLDFEKPAPADVVEKELTWLDQ